MSLFDRSFRSSVVLVPVLLLSSGCAKPPTAEFEAARGVVARAEAVDASRFAPEAWASLQQSIEMIETEIETQGEAFAMSRNYDHAKELISDLSAQASTAIEAAEAGKQQALSDAENALANADEIVASASTMITELGACERKPKGFAADLEAMSGRLDALVSRLTALQAPLAEEDFERVTSEAAILMEEVGPLVDDLSAAKAKLGC